MGIFDIIDDIAEKQVTKTETGDNRIFGVVVGEVTAHYDKQKSKNMPGRVCVKIPIRNGKTAEGEEENTSLQWAHVAMPYMGSGWGEYFLPEVGDQVLLVFEQGLIERPYIIGCVPKDQNSSTPEGGEVANNKYIQDVADPNNVNKKIQTKNGNTLHFYDAVKREGDTESKNYITMHTPKKMHTLTLNDDKKKIELIGGAEAENGDPSPSDATVLVQMNSDAQKGEIYVKASKKLRIEVGEDISIVMNDGKITINAKQVSSETTSKTIFKSNNNIQLEGTNIKAEAQTNLDLKASAKVAIEGGIVKTS